MRLYFFPGLIPLATLAPELLSLFGAFAAAVFALKHRPRIALAFMVIAALAVGAQLRLRSQRHANLPTLVPTLEKLPQADTRGRWSQLLPRAPLSSLTLDPENRLVIFGTRQNTVDAFSIRNGTLVFSLAMAEPVLAAPVIDGGRAYLGEGLHEAKHSRLVAIELPSGNPLWQYGFASHLESSPRVSDDHKTLWGCAGGEGLYSLDASHGQLLWKSAIGHCDSTPWFEASILYALASKSDEVGKSQLVAVNSQDGRVLWAVEIPGQPWGTVVRDRESGYLLFTSGNGNLFPATESQEAGWSYALNTGQRKLAWTRDLLEMPLLESVLFPQKGSAGLIIHALKKGEIVALDAKTGARRWSHLLPSPILSPLRMIPGTDRIVALAWDGTLTELNAASGEIASIRPLPSQSTSAPVFEIEHAYFAGRAELQAISLHDGKLNP